MRSIFEGHFGDFPGIEYRRNSLIIYLQDPYCAVGQKICVKPVLLEMGCGDFRKSILGISKVTLLSADLASDIRSKDKTIGLLHLPILGLVESFHDPARR